ncbi:hypothetical protein [Shimazuella kribbensis]|uniref:hypothetical protein n=1 Tax=Shimazuella kribbensis TaxID=139808 RepID=UPI00048A7813|nr:hypothetical protein [Shimazuella kribbensis]
MYKSASYWPGAAQLALNYLSKDFGSTELNRVKMHVFSLLLTGKSEEADRQAEFLCEPFRSQIKCEISYLSHTPSYVAGNMYYVEAYSFAFSFIYKWNLSESQSLIRTAILREIFEGTPILAVSKAELLEDQQLQEEVLMGIRYLLHLWDPKLFKLESA